MFGIAKKVIRDNYIHLINILMTFTNLVIRNESKINEYRTPLVPHDVKILIKNGFNVYVISSNVRCYKDSEYANAGAIILMSFEEVFELDKLTTLIIGLKELDMQYIGQFAYTHLYFSHTLKGQIGANDTLELFKLYGGKLYDLEYIVDHTNKRLVSFGTYAGIAGTLLGIKNYTKHTYFDSGLVPMMSLETELQELVNTFKITCLSPSICIIGSNGRCGIGAKYVCDKLGLSYTCLGRNDDKSDIWKYDIVLNCIFLADGDNIKPFVTHNTIKDFCNCTIVDVSCDCNAHNNPIAIYTKSSTHADPILSYYGNDHNVLIDLIAIDNLPTLLPKDSSKYFSNKLAQLISKINIDHVEHDHCVHCVWKRALDVFIKAHH
jgi:saccharopine dehydrogenase (NAD+, L-lysine forming)